MWTNWEYTGYNAYPCTLLLTHSNTWVSSLNICQHLNFYCIVHVVITSISLLCFSPFAGFGAKQPKDQKKDTYNPNKSKYHPVDDACWKRGEKWVQKFIGSILFTWYDGVSQLHIFSCKTNIKITCCYISDTCLKSGMMWTPMLVTYSGNTLPNTVLNLEFWFSILWSLFDHNVLQGSLCRLSSNIQAL